ncbi:hypothetical protein [Streptomyces sp. NPDC059743]|uniref:hypothetical protein n=1 Tax=Streptomyces sp. NPDC059743 TaxID=3346928 RepID=UPI003653A8CF
MYGEYADGRSAINWLDEQGASVSLGKDLMDHARTVAEVVRNSQSTGWGHDRPWPTMRLFFEILSRARSFVHFASWGISHIMIGALKMTSMRAPVYGFVSQVEDHARMELTEFPKEAPNLKAKVINPREANFDAPHQKLVIVDGLLAFKGSTNLTNAAMRKADRGLDLTEVVTDYESVADLNNRYFAPVWKAINAPEVVQKVMWADPWE